MVPGVGITCMHMDQNSAAPAEPSPHQATIHWPQYVTEPAPISRAMQLSPAKTHLWTCDPNIYWHKPLRRCGSLSRAWFWLCLILAQIFWVIDWGVQECVFLKFPPPPCDSVIQLDLGTTALWSHLLEGDAKTQKGKVTCPKSQYLARLVLESLVCYINTHSTVPYYSHKKFNMEEILHVPITEMLWAEVL